VGGGAMLDRLIPIQPVKTTDTNTFVLDANNNKIVESIKDGDTTFELYTLRGVKLMGRMTLDPKKLVPDLDIFGPEDGKIYGELAVLGVKNYGKKFSDTTQNYGYYNDIFKRMPIMFGFIAMSLPSGLALYWIVSNIFSMVMQFFFLGGWGGLSRSGAAHPQAGGKELRQRITQVEETSSTRITAGSADVIDESSSRRGIDEGESGVSANSVEEATSKTLGQLGATRTR
jgi:hypothetical protein